MSSGVRQKPGSVEFLLGGSETRLEFDHSLHDAYIEAVALGPRREVRLTLALGSARMSDPRLPDAAILRMGAIENLERVREFFARFERDPVARIDRLIVQKSVGSRFTVTLEIDPQGTVAVECSKLDLAPNDPA
jgi:hypothetical protein